jgi:hypothetical protein
MMALDLMRHLLGGERAHAYVVFVLLGKSQWAILSSS